jgi:hypothetical protein
MKALLYDGAVLDKIVPLNEDLLDATDYYIVEE